MKRKEKKVIKMSSEVRETMRRWASIVLCAAILVVLVWLFTNGIGRAGNRTDKTDMVATAFTETQVIDAWV